MQVRVYYIFERYIVGLKGSDRIFIQGTRLAHQKAHL